jgi:hypothetical protein
VTQPYKSTHLLQPPRLLLEFLIHRQDAKIIRWRKEDGSDILTFGVEAICLQNLLDLIHNYF